MTDVLVAAITYYAEIRETLIREHGLAPERISPLMPLD